MEKLILTQRQWNQIRAALQFWACVDESSKVPPIKHPRIQSFFEKISALSLTEIAELMDYNLVPETMVEGTSLQQIAQERGYSVRRLLAQLKRMDIQAVGRVERANIYRLGDVLKACRMIRKREWDRMRQYERGFFRGLRQTMANRSAKTSGNSSE